MDSDKKFVSSSLLSSTSTQFVMLLTIIVGAFLLGSLWTKVKVLEQGGAVAGTKALVANNAGTGSGTGENAQAPTPEVVGEVPPITDRDHVRGNRNARIALIEYSDLECPYCQRFHPTAKQAVDTYKDKIFWVYRHFPLSFHANAQKESEASECVYELGGDDAFWKYIDAIYERTTANGTGFALDKLGPLAAEVGVDQAKFQTCLDEGKYTKYIQDDMNAGSKAGINGTPGNILLDTKTGKTKMIPGAVPFDQLKTSIDELLAEG